MGNNVDLVEMLGLPEVIQCPHCSASIDTHFNDHDIECGTDYTKGHWKTHMYCPECDKDFEFKFKIQIVELK